VDGSGTFGNCQFFLLCCGESPTRAVTSVDIGFGENGDIVLTDRYGRMWSVLLLKKAVCYTEGLLEWDRVARPLCEFSLPEFRWSVPLVFIKADGSILRLGGDDFAVPVLPGITRTDAVADDDDDDRTVTTVAADDEDDRIMAELAWILTEDEETE